MRLRPDSNEVAEYVASMLDELANLSKPLQDANLTSLLKISADLARKHYVMNVKFPTLQDEILLIRLKLAEPAVKSKRVIRSSH